MQKQFLALKASAGSGKTFNLSLRFIYLLFQGANPHQILTLTFTKKASSEMHHRIYEHLKSLEQSFWHNTFKDNDIYKELLQRGLSHEQMSENIAPIFATFMQSSPRITTIDSFFHAVLKKFCWYVGVSSSFEVGQVDKGEVYELFLDSLSYEDRRDFARFCFAQKLSIQSVLLMLDTFSLLPEDVLADSYSHEISDLSIEQIAQKISASMEQICNELKRQNAGVGAIDLFDKTFEGVLRGFSVRMLTDWQAHRNLKKFDLSSMDRVRDEIMGLFFMYFQHKQGQIITQLTRYIHGFKKAKERVLGSRNVLDFESVMMKNYELLAQNVDREFFYFRLDDRITHVLLDEFQDTSCMQYQILKPIIDEILSGDGRIGDRSVFIVGDEKQSIYMFRGSFAGVFEEATKPLDKRSLEYNYRSSKRVIDYNNAVFSQCFSHYVEQKYPSTSESCGFVRILPLVSGGAKEEAEQVRDALISQVYNELALLLQSGASEDEIAILVFKNDDVLTLKEYIQARMPELQILTETSSRLFEKKEVKILINALRYVLMTSLLYKQEDKQEQAQIHKALKLYEKRIAKLLGLAYASSSHALDKIKALNLCENTPPAEAILALIEAFDIAQSVSWRFLELGCEYRSIEEFLHDIPTILCSAPTQSNCGVKIMTIHKSKGLEFQYVILCDRLSKPNYGGDKFIAQYDGAYIKRLFCKMSHREAFDEVYRGALEAHEFYANQEKLNVLYVAFTRAKQGLSVVGREKGNFDILGLIQQCDEIPRLHGAQQLQSEQACQILLHAMPEFGEQEGFIRVEQNDGGGVYDVASWRNIIFGNALHCVFELYLGYKASLEDIEHIVCNRYGFALSQESMARAIQKAMSCIHSPEFEQLLCGKQIACEVSYMQDNRLYRMDTLLYDESEWIVLDYKSALADYDSHAQQVREYMRFLTQRYGAPQQTQAKKIRGFVVYPLGGRNEQFMEVRH